MKTIQKTTLRSVLTSVILCIYGCGEGASNNKAVLEPAIAIPPTGTRTMIDINNDTDRTYVRAILVDSNTGNTLKQEQIDCKAHSGNCMMYLPNKVTHSATLLVQDAQQRMIGAFIFPSDGVQSFSHVNPTNKSTGKYLAQRLFKDYLAKDKIDYESLTLRLQNFFQNYAGSDGSADPYEELGDYYALQTTNSPITEHQFQENLAKRLINWEIAKPEELPKPKKQASLSSSQKIAGAFSSLIAGEVSLIREAHAQAAGTGSCSQQTKDFLKVASIIGKAVPKAGAAISGAADMGTKACGADPTSKILSAITQLRSDVETVNRELGMLSTYIYDKDIRTTNDAFWKIYTDTDVYINSYSTFIKNTEVPSKKEPGKEPIKTRMSFPTLDAYFAEFKNRGYSTAETIKFGSNQLALILNTANVVDKLAGSLTVPNMTTYTTALNYRCATPRGGRPGENFLNVRTFCNTSIMSNVALLAGTQASLVGVLKDVYSTMEKYQVPTNDYVKPVGVPEYSAAGIAKIEELFRTSQSKVLDPIQTDINATGDPNRGYYSIYAGLPNALLTNLVARECSQIGNGKQNLPSISGWFLPTASRVEDNYIETECQLINADNNTKRPVKARYYYTNQGTNVDPNDVANVLGVPVAMHYVKSGEAFNKSVTSEYAGMQSVVFTAPKLVAFNNDASAGKINGVVPQKDIKELNYVLHSMSYRSWYFNAKIPQNRGSGHTWVSFRDKDGVNAVVSLKINYNTYSATSEKRDDSYFHLRCVTEDCRVEPTQSQWLSFRSGLNVDISDQKKQEAGGELYQLGPLQ